MGTVPTVKVKHGDGFRRINVSDFDAATMAEYEEPSAKDGAGSLLDVNVSDLAAALARVSDAAVVRKAAKADKRKSAAEHYDARLAELEG